MMRRLAVLIAVLSPAAASAQMSPDGFIHYADSHVNQTIQCGRAPIELDGSHTNLTVVGPCREIRIVGEHNDIYADVLAGGVITILGGHNDVTWRQVSPGPPPMLSMTPHNSFHLARQ